jgi:hypothetical protein
LLQTFDASFKLLHLKDLKIIGVFLNLNKLK